MTAAQVLIAKGIEAALTEAIANDEFSLEIATLVRSYGELSLELRLQDDTTRLDIVPSTAKIEKYDREALRYLVTTALCLRHKFPGTSVVSGQIPATLVDPYMDLSEEIFNYFSPKQPGQEEGLILPDSVVGAEYARWEEGGVIEAPYDIYLNQQATFLSIIRINYVVAVVP